MWNSFHSEHTASTGTNVESWYESDIYGKLTAGRDWYTLGLIYTFYTYPSNGAFDTVQEIGLTAGLNLPDDQWWGQLIGDVSLGVYLETDHSNVGQDNAAYFQLDFGPSLPLFDGKATLSFPVSLGLSLDDYYVGADDDTFGFLQGGIKLTVPLDVGDFGTVNLTAGVNGLLLGETTEAINSGDDFDGYGYVGLALSY
jgi:hypothetical protein